MAGYHPEEAAGGPARTAGPAGPGVTDRAPAYPRWPDDSLPAQTGPLGPPRAPQRGPDGRRRPTRARGWLLVAVVAAAIGGGVGAGVTAALDKNGTAPTIQVSRTPPGPAYLSGTASIPKLVTAVVPAVVSIDVQNGGEEDQGTGMIISSDGEVVTNNHVIALAVGGGSISVTESGKTAAQPATLIGADPGNDLALLQVTGASGLPTVTLGDSNLLQVGDAVVAIGNALGLQAGTPTVTEGIVSALGRTVTAGSGTGSASETLTNMIQTDAAINPGNSGGPLIDTAGQVIGMNTAVAGTTGDGSNAQNIGFAIPSSRIEALLPELQKGGTTRPDSGAIGADLITMTAQLRQQYGFTPTSGAVVQDVVTGSPAARAGLQTGEVIVAVDGQSVSGADQVQAIIENHRPGDSVQITYFLGENKTSVTVGVESESQLQQQERQSPLGAGLGSAGPPLSG